MLEVSFLCRGNIEYPTSLRSGATLNDHPIYAFRLGNATSKRPPKYSYVRYNSSERNFECAAVLYRDGSAYLPYEDARSVADKDKLRIYNAYSHTDQYGLLHVFFEGVGLIGNKPIWPTALAAGKSLLENAKDAFWGGSAGLNMPANFTGYDEAEGWSWRTETVLNGDGSAIAENGGLASSYSDWIDYTIPGRVDLSADQGFITFPPIQKLVKATVKIYIAKNGQDFGGQPIVISQWAGGGYRATVEDKDGNEMLLAKSQGFSGHLAGVVAISVVGGTFMGYDCTAAAATLSSVPPFAAWAAQFVSGATLEKKTSFLFDPADGVQYNVIKEIVLAENTGGGSGE